MKARRIVIGRSVLDHQIVDSQGRRCGNVDDLAIEGGPGDRAEVVALLVGPGYWGQRSGRIGGLAGWIGGGRRVRVPWTKVSEVNSALELSATALELGLGAGDDRLRPFFERIPGARH